MSFGIHTASITLDGAGAGSAELQVEGVLTAIRVTRNSGSPVVTVADIVETFLDGVTVAADTTYALGVELVDNAAAASGVYARYQCTGTLTITVTGGAASGNVTVYIKVV